MSIVGSGEEKALAYPSRAGQEQPVMLKVMMPTGDYQEDVVLARTEPGTWSPIRG